MMSLRSGSSRLPLAPLAALFALAVLAMAWVASAHVCARPVMVTLCGRGSSHLTMGSMSMSMPMPTAQTPLGNLTICPVVVGLILIATLLSAWAIIAGWRDRHRVLTLTVLTRTIATLPVMRTFVALAASGGLAIGTIVAVDGDVALSLSLCATLALILAGISILATLAALAIARFVVALCVRFIVALSRAIGERNGCDRRASMVAVRPLPVAPFPIAFGRGLRAPPLPIH